MWPNVKDPAIEHNFAPRIYQMASAFRQLRKKTGAPQPLIKLAAYVPSSEKLLDHADTGSRFRHIREVIAAPELGCHSVTVSASMIQELADTRYDSRLDIGKHRTKPTDADFYASLPEPSERLQPLLASDPLRDTTTPFQPVDIAVDYLDNNAAMLVEALERDPAGQQRLEDAIALFIRAEQASKALIESITPRSAL